MKGCGVICKPLFVALKKDGFIWNDEQKIALRNIKTTMSSTPIMALLDYSQPFILEADVCGYGIGAVLIQNGRPIYFMSKSIGPKSAAISTYDNEDLVILEAIKK